MFGLLFASLGVAFLITPSAATPTANIEPETGTVASPTNVVTDASASSDSAVKFSTTTSPSGEPMPVGDLSGWKQIFTDDFTINVPLGSFPGPPSDASSGHVQVDWFTMYAKL